MATTKTELYNNGTLVATKTSAPFNTFDWTPASAEVGSASLTVKRYEDGVLAATSAAVGGTVDAAAGAGYTALSFPTQNPAGSIDESNNQLKYSGSGVTNFGNNGLSNSYLPADTDGGIAFYCNSTADELVVIGFKDTNATGAFSTQKAGVYLDAGSIVRNAAGSTGALSYSAVGEWVRVYREAGVYKIQTSADKTTWTDRYTFAYTSTVAMYVAVSVHGGGTALMNNPESIGLI